MTAPVPVAMFQSRAGKRKLVIGLSVALAVSGFIAANAHLVYVAVSSQPDCVSHLKDRGDTDGGSGFRAARSSC